ncbi:Uncharacterized protein FKW44_011088 [Caligus rogercresseyi]|uniref:Uncharacterized protein n=1 Tax=Caligus rogercresseyi TaxID=217165 RepID=A0A7T8HII7_CALRO|nr:Uncharacterized protein FKW44_011088 [Caligus rogercresseyi]
METPDFRSYFLIRIKLARTVNEIHEDLLSTFPDSFPGLSTLQRWHTEFHKGVFALEKKTCPGCPREMRTKENVARVKCLLIEYLRTTGKRFLSLKKDKIRLKDSLIMEFLTRRDVEPVKQSPYSSDLNLCDRFLFRKVKHLLREDEFGGHEEATLALYDQLRKLWGHCHDVIAVGGDYVY